MTPLAHLAVLNNALLKCARAGGGSRKCIQLLLALVCLSLRRSNRRRAWKMQKARRESRPALSYGLILSFVLSGVSPPRSSFLTSLHRVPLKVSCVSLPPVTSPTSVLTSSLHFFVCPACNRGYPEPARIGSSAGNALCLELTCAC